MRLRHRQMARRVRPRMWRHPGATEARAVGTVMCSGEVTAAALETLGEVKRGWVLWVTP